MRIAITVLYVTLYSILISSVSLAAEPSKTDIEFFETKIRPVLVSHCYKCHSAKSKEPKGGLLLDTRAGIRRGGETGHGVVPGELGESQIIAAIRYESLEMPPDQQLPAAVIADFEKWVKRGAADPREGRSLIQRKIDFDKARTYWAYQPIRAPSPPKLRDASWPRTKIDEFILARLESNQLHPTKDAEPITLVRRIYVDLIGLPPSPEQVDAFLADCATSERSSEIPQEALERLIDELLASPQFGERWGRHWLDVARYGESTGMERNYTYPHAWRYRDYVIASMNADTPFDQFIKEQLAGDLLIAQTEDERYKYLVATGFLAIGPKSLNERNREQFVMDIVDDQIDVTSRAFLGLTVSCARCHDHKFDAIPQAEYYALAGIFRSTNTFYGTGGGGGNRQSGQLLGLRGMHVSPVKVGAGNSKSAQAVKKLAAQVRKLEAQLKRFQKNDSPAGKTRAEKIEKQLIQLRKRLAATKKKSKPEPPTPDKEPAVLVMGVQDDSDPSDTQVRVRGEPNDRADTIPRGFLTVATIGATTPPTGDSSGRLELAEWIVHPENPLTARVAVNRLWKNLFGSGLVSSLNNFGNNGELPSHPQLLDYLAATFVEDGWSSKRLIKQVMMSRVYQMSCRGDIDLTELDPENRLLSRQNQRRMEAEVIRDAMLVASGQLDLKPAEGSVVSDVGDGNVGRGLSPERFAGSSTKRSVYLPIVRAAVPEILRVFDFPEPSIIAAQRDVTTVPTQALYMLNSPFVLGQSKALAERIARESGSSPQDRIVRAFRLTLSRSPTDDELARAQRFVSDASDDQVWAELCHVLIASAEFRYIN
jgi:hypothetical protein